MTGGIVDTTVIIHYLRRMPAARAWLDAQSEPLAITSINWMEIMVGVTSKADQDRSRNILDQFELLYPIPDDQRWAMEQLERYQFSHHIGMNDCLIASVARRTGLPFYTHNLRDMSPLLGQQATQPYA